MHYIYVCLDKITYSNENMINEEEGENESFIPTIYETIQMIHKSVKNVYERLIKTQDNLREIIRLSSQWNNIPLYSRDKIKNIITFDKRLGQIKTKRYTEIEDSSKQIQKLLRENLLLFHNVPLRDPNLGKFVY